MTKTLERYQKCNYGAPEPNVDTREALVNSFHGYLYLYMFAAQTAKRKKIENHIACKKISKICKLKLLILIAVCHYLLPNFLFLFYRQKRFIKAQQMVHRQ